MILLAGLKTKTLIPQIKKQGVRFKKILQDPVFPNVFGAQKFCRIRNTLE
jgi:hypothetical protein